MAKAKLPKIAIQYIIECRDDPYHIRTWQDIASMVKDKFNIEVSLQAVAQTYKRHRTKFTGDVEHKTGID